MDLFRCQPQWSERFVGGGKGPNVTTLSWVFPSVVDGHRSVRIELYVGISQVGGIVADVVYADREPHPPRFFSAVESCAQRLVPSS